MAQAPEETGEEEPVFTEEELDAAEAESGGPPPGVDVMQVRGRGIAAIETEVPASVTQFDAATIEALGAADISDLSRVTPNVSIVQPGSTQSTFFIRGIGLSDFSSNAAGAITIFQDDVSLNAPAIQTGQLFDVRNVQIVRGPQGSGPFRNASAGAIRVESALPTGDYGAQLRTTFGRYDADSDGAEDAFIQEYEGYVEAPLIPEVLSSRFAFRLRQADPYKTNGCADDTPLSERTRRGRPFTIPLASICGERSNFQLPPGQVSRIPVGLDEEVQDENNWAARGVLRFQPPDTRMEFRLNGHGSKLNQDPTFGQAIGTFQLIGSNDTQFGGEVARESTRPAYWEPDQQEEWLSICPAGSACDPSAGAQFAKKLAEERPLDKRPFRGDYNKIGRVTRDTWGTNLAADMEFDAVDVFAIASVDAYDRYQDRDTDFTPEVLFEGIDEDEAWQTYEEIRLSGELADEPFGWEVGGFYLREELEVEGLTEIGSGTAIRRSYTQDIDSFAVWGEFTWDFLDDLTVEGGVRFNYEKKKFDLTRNDVIFGNDVSTSRGKQDETWTEPTGELTLRWHIDEDASAYAKYSRGFKAGHFNALAERDAVDLPPADEEINNAWEAGLAGSWFDRRLSLSTSAFYYRYDDYQVFLFRDSAGGPPVLEVVNAEKAENYGIEIEGRAEPLRGWAPRFLEGLRVSGNFSWLHGEFLDFQNVVNEQIGGNQLVNLVTDFSGDRLLNSPEYTVSGTVEWPFDLGRFGTLTPRYDFNWSDDVFFGVNEGRGAKRTDGTDELPDFGTGQPAFWLHNVRLAYRSPNGMIEVAGWIRNIDNEVYKNFAFDVSRFRGVVLNFVGPPRTMGVDVTVTF